MDSIKQNLPKIIIGTVGATAIAFVLYKLLAGRGDKAAFATSLKAFAQSLDQNASYTVKQQQAHEQLQDYIKVYLGEETTLTLVEGRL